MTDHDAEMDAIVAQLEEAAADDGVMLSCMTPLGTKCILKTWSQITRV